MTGPVTMALRAMQTDPDPPRRGFLRGLLSLPLIGGSVALIGAPSAVAEPCTLPMLQTYSDWLAREFGETLIELAPLTHPQRDELPGFMTYATQHARNWCEGNALLTRGSRVSFEVPPRMLPSTRAALVLSTVGCDWRR